MWVLAGKVKLGQFCLRILRRSLTIPIMPRRHMPQLRKYVIRRYHNTGPSFRHLPQLRPKKLLILSRFRGCAWLIRRVLDWMIGFIVPDIFTQLRTLGNTVLPLFYILRSSPFHTHYDSQSSLAVYWQRIYDSLNVTWNHTWSHLFTA
jgi:hypothetical protein